MPRILYILSILLLAIGGLTAIASRAAAESPLSTGVERSTTFDEGSQSPLQFAAAPFMADDASAVESDDGLATAAPGMAATLGERPLRSSALAVVAPDRAPSLVTQRVRLKI